MKKTLFFVAFSAALGLLPVSAEVDCLKLAISVKALWPTIRRRFLKWSPPRWPPHPVAPAKSSRPPSKDPALPETVAAIVEAAITAAPDQMRLIAQCAVAVAPDALS
jgi:hypothetical protein